MRRVVITGYGIVSSLGNNREEVSASLSEGKSGIEFCQEYADMNFRSHIHGPIRLNIADHVDRKVRRFMGDGAAYSYIAMDEAIRHAGLEESEVSNEKTGLIVGVGGTSNKDILETIDSVRNKGARKVGPYMVPRTMASSNSACLATPFKIKGHNYTLSSACATSSHCIGNGVELIQMGKQDRGFAGGGDEVFWISTVMFDAMGALSSNFNDQPTKASRAYDKDRDGFVISGGAGVVCIEALEVAQARGAKIYGEIVGYGASSDGYNMVAPSGEGAIRCMKMAMETCPHRVDYINTHGTSTPAGDVTELGAIGEVFAGDLPYISSTKSLSGHALGAAGVNEMIYSLEIMQGNYIAASANIENLDEGAAGFPIVQEKMTDVKFDTVLSNSFGFGGTNAALVVSRFNG